MNLANPVSYQLESENGEYDLVSFSPRWSSPVQRAIKRTIDVVGSSVLLVLLSPVLFVLAVLVKLSSPGPILYRWRIAGKNGRPVTSYKFRSMYVNADEMKQQFAHLNEMCGPAFKITGDPRITPLGRWIRRYSLDELPQLYTVLSVVPGLTCLWQVSGRNQISDYDDWVRLDLEYIRQWSVWLDIKILFKTIREVLRGSGK